MVQVSPKEFKALVKMHKAKLKQRKLDNTKLDKAAGRTILASVVRKNIVAQLDKLFSLYIRLRDKLANNGKCMFDCGRPIECCFHFITRSKYSVRWDVTNAVGSCFSDNYQMEFNPHPYVKWFIDKRGQLAYDVLIAKSNRIAKFENTDLLEIKRRLRSWIEDFRTIH